MKPGHYEFLGWLIFLSTVFLATLWSLQEKGLTAWLIAQSREVTGTELRQISWVLTFLVVAFPGYVIKRFFDDLAWQERIRRQPPPDKRQSAKKSRYIEPPVTAEPPKPVEVKELPKNQKEFIATCPACGNLFPAARDARELKCPSCEELVPLQ